jgi:catechol 2,3-dioxygenase-like lactoylglutathione lyase family enzyme
MVVMTRYVHTNIVASDWRRLAAFYVDVLGCEPVPPERHLSGEWLERATGLPGARIEGVHLRLSGFGDEGPTLEIFQYGALAAPPTPVLNLNRPGLGHLAFAVDDVASALGEVLAAGGGAVGEIVTLPVPGAGSVTFVYARDPEGNVLELQHWDDAITSTSNPAPHHIT